MCHSRGLLPQTVSGLNLLILKTEVMKTLPWKLPLWGGREGLTSYADPFSGFLTVSPTASVSGRWLSTSAFETSLLFLQAWGFSRHSPLTYRVLSPRLFKSSSVFNLRSWSFPLLKLWPSLSTGRAIHVVSHNFDGFRFQESFAYRWQNHCIGQILLQLLWVFMVLSIVPILRQLPACTLLSFEIQKRTFVSLGLQGFIPGT